MSPVELHAHSFFSFLDALASPEELVARAKDLDYTACALTDHGGMFGIPRFLRAAKIAGIKPIVGCEVYVSPTTRADRSPDLRPVGHHLTLLAETAEGYRNLAALSSAGYAEGFYHRPRVDHELLARHAKGLILLTGCIHSAVCEKLLASDRQGADEWVRFYVETFGRDQVFVEIQRHGLKAEESLLEELALLSKRHRLSKVATNDVHYLNSEDAEAHIVAMDMRSKKLPSDPRRERFSKPAYGLLTAAEWSKAFKSHPDALESAETIAGRCAVSLVDVQLKPDDDRVFVKRLRELVEKAAVRKFGKKTEELELRIAAELEGLRSRGLSEYMIMIHELVSEAKRRGIAVGPGRGSSAGSLVAWLLDITEVNPLEYGLSFERFLSPSRPTLPDVDIDVDAGERPRLIEILHEQRASSRTFRAGTISSIGLKSSIREVARSRGMPYREADEKIKSIPPGVSQLEQNEKPPWSDLAPMIHRLAPLPRTPMGHPTAVVVVPQSHADVLPVYTSAEGQSWLQFDGADLDVMGIPKLDLLPLKILSVISETMKWLKLSGSAAPDFSSLPLNDPLTFQMLSNGDTAGLFQLESPGMRELLRELAPHSIETLAAALALYRPGPLESDVPRQYIERKNGRSSPSPPHPMFESILKETHGLILYQEQVMACAGRAGQTPSDADDFRVAMSKKNPESMKRACERFEKALTAGGLTPRESAAVVSQITAYAGFSFNKSHAVSYAILAYRAAFLKAHSPAAFLASSANVHLDDRGQMGEIFSEARRMGLQILPPDVNTAGAECGPGPDGKSIRLGIGLVRHVPDGIAAAILRARPFADIPDLLMKVPAVISSRLMEMLCKAGALDGFGNTRSEILGNLPAWTDRVRKSSTQGGFQIGLFGDDPAAVPPESGGRPAPDLPPRNDLFWEHEALGCFATGSPLDDFKESISEFCSETIAQLLSRASLSSPASAAPAALVTSAGLLTALRPHVDRGGREMAFVKLDDGSGILDVVFFHDIFLQSKPILTLGAPLLVRGRLEKRGVSVTLLAEQAVGMDQPERLYESILIKFDAGMGVEIMRKIKTILKEHLGDRPVHVEMETSGGASYEFRIGWSCRPSAVLRRKLESVLGPYSVFFLKVREEPLRT